MAVDVRLLLDSNNTVTTDQNTTYIDVEGGGLMWAVLYTGAMSGSGTTCDIRVMFSLDVGANYYMAGKFQTLGPTNDNIILRIPVYIPLPATATNKTRVRLNYDVAGSSPSYLITTAFIEPITSIMSSPGTDKVNAIGVYALVAAT